MRWKSLILLSLGIALSGCSDSLWFHPSVSTPQYPISPKWTPEQVKIQCLSGDCPNGVGLIMFISKEGRYRWRASRCTATLIAQDRILTNNHCNSPNYDEAYFWAQTSDGVRFRPLDRRVFAVASPQSGIGRDLAIWTLATPFPKGYEREISRALPSPERMRHMVAYVINGRRTDYDATDFNLERKDCRTLDHVPLVDGGVEDQAIGLSLFDCQIKHGNSGSPVFLADDFKNVQAVINTLWNAPEKNGPWEEALPTLMDQAQRLLFDPPAFYAQEFGMAERVQCLEIPGWPSPQQLCKADPPLRWRFARRVREMVQDYYGHPSVDRGIAWGVRAVSMHIFGQGSPGVAIVPYAVCKVDRALALSEGSSVRPAVHYIRLGMETDGKITGRLLTSDPLLESRQVAAQSGLDVKLSYISLSSDFVFESQDRQRLDQMASRQTYLKDCAPEDMKADMAQALQAFSDRNAWRGL